jgi:hypothetical protein
VLPALLQGTENWTITARDARRITGVVMKQMRKTAGYTWTDDKTNIETAKLNITPVLYKVQEYRRFKVQPLNGMPHKRLPRIL